MKTTKNQNVRKLNRQELKSLKAGDINKVKVCCVSNESGECCEWAKDIWYCQYIYC